MKVLIVGSNKHWAIERYFIHYLREMGIDIYQYNAPDIVFDNHSKNIINKILFKTGIHTGYHQVNEGLIQEVQLLKPDWVWVWKGMEIYPATLTKLRKLGVKLANFNPDHPFIITSAGSGNKNVSDSVGLYDLHFCYHRKLITEIEERFHIPAVFLPFAYEEKDIVYSDPSTIRENVKVCFQGNPDKYRERIIALLAAAGYMVDVYGHDWHTSKLTKQQNIRVFPIASRPEFWYKNQEYRIQLNLFREYNAGSHNMRTFEIPAAGGIQLTEYSEEQAEFFERDKEIFFFTGSEDLVAKVDEILKMPAEKISLIRNNARLKSLNAGYTFRDRAVTVRETFQKMLQ